MRIRCILLIIVLLGKFNHLTAFAASPSPFFIEISNSFRGSFAGTAAFADYDNDGLVDLLLTGTTNSFTPAHFTLLYHNNGAGNFVEVDAGLPGLIQGSTAWADYDRDGWLDLFIIGRRTNAVPFSALLRNRQDGTFTNINATIPAAQDTEAAWGDLDNDGAPDLLIAGEVNFNRLVAWAYSNGATGFSPNLSRLHPVQNGAAAWSDFDNDGDVDLLLVGDDMNYPLGSVTNLFAGLYRNDGGVLTNSGIVLPGMNGATVAWHDLDNDGDFDLLMLGSTNVNGGVSSNETVLIFRNDGAMLTPMNADFPDAGLSSFACADFDNDGWSDLLITGLGVNPSLSGLFLGSSNGVFTPVTNSGLARMFAGRAAFADVDNDGRLDILLTGATNGFTGTSRLFLNTTAVSNTPPTVPAGLSVEVASDGRSAILRWDASTDAQTPSPGLTYNVRIGSTPGGLSVISPPADLVTGRLRIPQDGNAGHRRWTRIEGLTPGAAYFWSVQAVDNGFAASKFAAENSFSAIGPANFVASAKTASTVVFTCRGTPNQPYTVLVTSNLVAGTTSNWTVFTNTVSDATGLFEFVTTREAPQRFFRTVHATD